MARGISVTLRAVGATSILLALTGFAYNAKSFAGVLRTDISEPAAPYLTAAFLTLSGVCVVCYLALLVLGIDFLRLQTRGRHLFAVLMAFEVLFPVLIRLVCELGSETVAMSVAGATGISIGGLVPQFLLGFPLWAPVAIALAHRSANRVPWPRSVTPKGLVLAAAALALVLATCWAKAFQAAERAARTAEAGSGAGGR